MIKLATVFSGIGAVEQALKRLNIDNEIIFACDNGEREVDIDYKSEFEKIKQLKTSLEKRDYVKNLYSQKTKKKNYMEEAYKSNYNIKDDMFFQDVCLLDGRDFRDKVDLFVGGSPCQSFSIVGKKGGFEDTRGTLFYEFARLVSEIQPKVFIYENVRNLIKHDKGRTWETIQNVFNELGYQYKYAVLNAADYGIPQNRRRLFVIGFKNNSNFEMPPKIQNLLYSMKDFTMDNCKFGNFTYLENGELLLKTGGEKVDEKYFLTPKLYNYVMKGGTKTFYQKPQINMTIARTLLKTMGNRHRAGIDNYISKSNSEQLGDVRMLTEREAHRLMGFTDDYKIVVSRAQAYKQAGNSIVVDVLMAILKEILKCGVL